MDAKAAEFTSKGLKTFPCSQSAADAECKRIDGSRTWALNEIFSEVRYREICKVIVIEKMFGEKEVRLAVKKQGCIDDGAVVGGRVIYAAVCMCVN